MASALRVECSTQPLDVSFHPGRPSILAAALIDGTLEVHDFATLQRNQVPSRTHEDEDDDDTILSSTDVHTKILLSDDKAQKSASCRVAQFSADGAVLWSGGSGGDIACLDAERIASFSSTTESPLRWRIDDASPASIHVLHEVLPSNLLASGDEDGCIRLWDTRLLGNSRTLETGRCGKGLPRGCVVNWKHHDDYISALQHTENGNTLLATAADASLSVYDLRMTNEKRPLFTRKSDDQEDELLSLQLMKNGKKVVCGTGEGVLAVFSYGTWGDVSDRFPGHPASVDALLKVDEDTLLTGSSDGWIRVVSIHPDKFIGIFGDDHDGLPLEKLQFNADRTIVGSVTHDNFIRLFDAGALQDIDDDDEEEEEEEEECAEEMGDGKEAAVMAATPRRTANGSDDEWDDKDEDIDHKMEESDGSEDEDDPREAKNRERARNFKSENEKFFDDL